MQGTRDFGIHYFVGAQLYLIGFTDSDWYGDSIDMKSTSIFLFMFGYGPICWSSKKQASLGLSSAKAEYQGAVNETIQVVWLHGILTEFGIQTSPLIYLLCDNQSAIKISSDPIQRKRTKHIKVHMHYIPELVHSKAIFIQISLQRRILQTYPPNISLKIDFSIPHIFLV